MTSYWGDSIEDFVLSDPIGKGGFAMVYKATSKSAGDEVAIKMIDKKKMEQWEGMFERVNKEIEIHWRLKHPSVLELYSFFQDDKHIYLVLQYCHNGNLNDYIKLNRLEEYKVQHLFKQVVKGVVYLHKHTIAHRDLSLANILLTKNMDAKIADFGLATKIDIQNDRKQYSICGTPNYISPEIATGKAHGLESDVWSLGCMLYVLLTGIHPFGMFGVRDTLTKVASAKFEMPKNLSQEAKDLISSLLQKVPSERLRLEQILDHPFLTKSYSSHVTRMTEIKNTQLSVDSGRATMSSRSGPIRATARLRSAPSSNTSTGNNQTAALSSVTSSQHHQHHCKHSRHNSLDSLTSSLSHKKAVCSSSSRGTTFSSPVFNHHQPPQQQQQRMIKSASTGHLAEHASSANSVSSVSNNTSQCLHDFCPPLNATRLRPIRHETRNTIVEINDTFEVCIEFLKSSKNKLVVTEKMKISPKGMEVSILRPLKSSSEKTQYSLHCSYSYHDLPRKYWKKYHYAWQFIQLVRSKTPKVIYYSDQAKCILMENDPNPDYEACFYNAAKVAIAASNCRIIDGDGNTHVLSEGADSNSLPETIKQLLEHAQWGKKHCLDISTGVSELEQKLKTTCFPVTFRRRPCPMPNTSENGTSNNSVGLGTVCQTSPSVIPAPNLSTKLGSYPATSSLLHSRALQPMENHPRVHNKSSSKETTTSKPAILKRVYIESTGWTTHLSNGEVSIQFCDGSQLKLEPSGDNPIVYTGTDHASTRYGYTSKLPATVQHKLSKVPNIVAMLTTSTTH